MSVRRFTGAKIVVFGGAGVGKTAFVVRYMTRRYIGDYDRNKEMLYNHKIPSPRDDVTLEIIDTAAKDSVENRESHIRWGDGFVFIYSITDRKSYEYANTLKDMLIKIRGPDMPAIVVANKCDLLSVRQVDDSEGVSLAEQLNCPKFDVSVAEGYSGVSEAMDELVIQLKREFVKNCSQAAVSANDKTKSKLFTFKKGFKKRISRSHSDTV
ncbi:ras-related and estrogen-regulated growth inhibitor-like [Saccostrea echinata]|uniref:ras-related and estrogen-regulated growth inhibitor-like n=1 Tax=Saccostrea echinata TaxID=191078 RepID=UPI002A7F7F22|nr:ras-related and estrogen-regulated growth inhibitor-like [Saccostrea echinata]